MENIVREIAQWVEYLTKGLSFFLRTHAAQREHSPLPSMLACACLCVCVRVCTLTFFKRMAFWEPLKSVYISVGRPGSSADWHDCHSICRGQWALINLMTTLTLIHGATNQLDTKYLDHLIIWRLFSFDPSRSHPPSRPPLVVPLLTECVPFFTQSCSFPVPHAKCM